MQRSLSEVHHFIRATEASHKYVRNTYLGNHSSKIADQAINSWPKVNGLAF